MSKQPPKYIIENLSSSHNKSDFTCGSDKLGVYLKTQASQDMKKNIAVTYVITQEESNSVLGFYTLSTISINAGELPERLKNKIPRYPLLPGVLLGRLAVDKKHQGINIGSYLLIDALKRSLSISDQVGVVAVIVDAKDPEAARFYQKFDFTPFPDNPLKLFLTISVIKKLNL